MIENARKWHFANPIKRTKIMRVLHYKNKYGLTIQDYNQMFDKQKGRCAVCGKHESELGKRLDIDHNHNTGKIRGLVCTACNRRIGRYEHNRLKNSEFLENIENYLAIYGI